jgi:hypothetical protein
MLSKQDIAMMTDGQREILYVGMKMEHDRIIKLLEQVNKEWVKEALSIVEGGK